MLQQSLTYIAGRNPDDCIVASVVGCGASEQLHPDYPLLEIIELAGNRLIYYVLEKLAASMTPSERIAFNHFFEVPMKRRKVVSGFRDFCEFCDPGAGRGGCWHIRNLRLRFWHSLNQKSTFWVRFDLELNQKAIPTQRDGFGQRSNRLQVVGFLVFSEGIYC
jgi:hypothetical protein